MEHSQWCEKSVQHPGWILSDMFSRSDKFTATDATDHFSHIEPALVISCDTCVMRDTHACDDCMMTYLCDQPEDGAVVLDLQELREVKLLAQAGLVPTLRHRAVG